MGRYSRVIVLVIFLASVAAPLNQFKVPPMMNTLMSSLDISIATSGLLMSVFALVGVILALPAGQIMSRMGLKATGVSALVLLLLGSVIGGFAQNATVILTSRVIEGAGMCFISVMAPAAITAWFPPEKRGLPMGIWASWVPAGSILMFNIAPKLGAWQNVWIFSSIYTAVVLFLMIVLFKMPPTQVEEEKIQEEISTKSPYANGRLWALAAMFLLFNVFVLSINTFMPMYLEIVQGYTAGKAASLASIVMVSALIMGPVTGAVLGIVKSSKAVIITGLLIGATMGLFVFNMNPSFIVIILIIAGAVIGMVPPATFATTPEVLQSPSQAGIGMSVVMFGQYLGMVIGPLMTGALISSASWSVAGYVLVPVMLMAVAIVAFIKVK